MLEFLHSLGLPQNLSLQGEYIDNANVLMHWLMLYLFIGWGAFFIVSLYKFRASKNKKADYYGVKSHLSSVLEGAVAIVEIIALFGFSYPIWAYRVNEVPDSRDAVNIRVIAQQFAWNIHYPGADGIFGRTDINLVDESEQNFIGIDRSDEFAKDDIILQNQMHIPVNKKIRVDLSSKDVIHNFKLPELRVSQDAIPGMTIPVHFTATASSPAHPKLFSIRIFLELSGSHPSRLPNKSLSVGLFKSLQRLKLTLLDWRTCVFHLTESFNKTPLNFIF